MPSQVFQRLLRQLHANGPEKGDGFGPSDFVGMTKAERVEARRLLSDALDCGDDTAVDGLVLLDGSAAREQLEAAVARQPPGSPGRLATARALGQITGDPAWLRVVAEFLGHPNGSRASLR